MEAYQSCSKCHEKLNQENKHKISFKNLQTNSGYSIEVCEDCKKGIEDLNPKKNNFTAYLLFFYGATLSLLINFLFIIGWFD